MARLRERWLAIPAAAALAASLALLSGDGQPRVVEPGAAGQPPSDALVLFDGGDLSAWRSGDGSPARAKVIGGELVLASGDGDIHTTAHFGDAQIHLEFLVPEMPGHEDQLKGNSGVFLHDCIEIQILDSWRNPTYPVGMLGAVYGLWAPLVNAARPPGEWQSFDILFRRPRCDDQGAVREAGRITLLLNGVVVQDAAPVERGVPGCGHPDPCAPGPLRLQDHSGFPGAPLTVMRFRNIWLRKLE